MGRMAMGIAIVLLLCGGAPTGADAQAAGAGPRDVREVFLALPFPAAAPSRPLLSRVAGLLATRELREAAWERAVAAGSGRAFLDARNAYLELCVLPDPAAECAAHLVMTYFVRADGERLVVAQVDDRGSIRTENHFWRLAGGRFTPVDGALLVPEVTYADFWDDQPLPRGVAPDFLRQLGAVRIDWPRSGTTAEARLETLDDGVKDPALAERLIDLDQRRRFESVALVWDRGRGVFTRGRRKPYEPDEDHHHH